MHHYRQPESSTRSLLEISGVILTGILHLVFVLVINARLAFIAAAVFAWLGYIVVRVWRDRQLLSAWGFRLDNLKTTFSVTSLFAAIAIATMALIASTRGSLHLHWHMPPLLVVYAIWGLIQQFLIQTMLVSNLNKSVVGSTWLATIASALLFGVVHLPDMPLAAATFFLGLVFTPIYLKWRNLWPLGVYHGWLGVFFYFWILNRDPWVEVFGQL